MNFIYCSLIGYFIGTISPSYIIAKIKGMDIKKKGSGNAGASNVLILFGKMLGVICAVLDIAKAYLSILLAEHLFPDFIHAFAVTGCACIIGHIFPFYMKFKGGKGLACLGGVILKFDAKIFFIILGVEMLIALITDYICFVPITASVAFSIMYGVITNNSLGSTILWISTVAILLKHVENIHRIKKGTEAHLSYLWKPAAELERLKESTGAAPTVFNDHFNLDDDE
ncbi:MAG: glycerol-3-phosphate acyltransferase [Ruminococcaceae bacterium]|nr:glycerol-3-phosphate acyltransferase [Oscillospiraceae bacterium]